MTKIIVTFLICIYSLHSYSQNEFVPNPTNIASFNLGEFNYQIWSALNNDPTKPTLWQFRYHPLFIPAIGLDGNVIFKQNYKVGNKFRTNFIVFLDNNKAQEYAYAQIRNAYPAQSSQIAKSNITAFQVKSIKIDLPDLRNISSTARIVNDEYFSAAAPLPNILIEIEDDSDEKLNQIKNELSATRFSYKINLNARTISQNSVSIKFYKLKEAKLYASLNGLPGAGEIRYIHRDDLRKLSERILEEINIEATIAEPEKFKEDLINDMLRQWATSTDAATFDANKFASTYNPDDLKPDQISKALDKMFTYNETKKEYKYNSSNEISGKGSFLDIFSAEAASKGTFSREELIYLLNKHDIEASFEGNKIVPKAIKVLQVNMSDFNSDKTLFSRMVYVKDAGLQELQNTPSLSSYSSIANILVENYFTSVPIGSILAFGGDQNKIPEGWMVCDGRALSRGEYPFLFDKIGTSWGAPTNTQFNIPDLQGIFLRGVDATANRDIEKNARAPLKNGGNGGNLVGSYQPDALEKHKHDVSAIQEPHDHGIAYGNSQRGTIGVVPASVHTSSNQIGKFHTISNTIVLNIKEELKGNSNETRPKNAYVYYIIRYK